MTSTPPTPPPSPPGLGMKDTPNAEKFVLEADAMRRRQLRTALVHGSRRTWREQVRVWPAVVVGIIVVAVIVAGLAVSQALRTTEKNQKKEQQHQQTPTPSAPASSTTPCGLLCSPSGAPSP